MTDEQDGCLCIVDCNGLHEIASIKSDNLKSIFVGQLQTGVIGVPACVWQEFKTIYEEEATELGSHVKNKIKIKQRYHVGAAALADKTGSKFPRGAYETHSDIYAATIATMEGYKLLTSSDQKDQYKGMGCKVMDLAAWADEIDGT